MLFSCISANVHNVQSACLKCPLSASVQTCSLLRHFLIAVSVTDWSNCPTPRRAAAALPRPPSGSYKRGPVESPTTQSTGFRSGLLGATTESAE